MPPYHTYSRWVLGGQTYIFAYRDINQQPEDMAVDIYIAKGGDYKRVGTARIPGVVTSVSTERLTGGILPDVVFRLQSGELQWIEVVRFFNRTARQVFWYGASKIDVMTQPKPMIVAKSSIPNLVQEFAWDSESGKFVKIGKYAWHKAP